MNKYEKPMLDTIGQINHLKLKGVKFDIISVDDAIDYLRENNNYFKLRAYRKNFPKHPEGINKDKYINLDFALLKDLSIIDMRMRYTFIQMALDIEHFAKVKLIHLIEESGDDGYKVIEDYFISLKNQDDIDKSMHAKNLENELKRNINNPYCGGIIKKYDGCYPVWAFVEIISFGTFINFYKFCSKQFTDRKLEDDFYLLRISKELRNAAAHSNCFIHDMGAKDIKYHANYRVLRSLTGITKSQKDSQLGNERMRQIITLLYTHTVFVTSQGVRNHTKDNLNNLVDRMYRNISFYNENENITASFGFFKKAVDILFV